MSTNSNKYFPGPASANAADSFCAYITSQNMGEYGYDLKWGMDCGFKIDADGPLIQFESRFYPEDQLNGKISIYIGDTKIHEVPVSADTPQQLAETVTSIHQQWKSRLIEYLWNTELGAKIFNVTE